jgi:hypothetical protein
MCCAQAAVELLRMQCEVVACVNEAQDLHMIYKQGIYLPGVCDSSQNIWGSTWLTHVEGQQTRDKEDGVLGHAEVTHSESPTAGHTAVYCTPVSLTMLHKSG